MANKVLITGGAQRIGKALVNHSVSYTHLRAHET